MFFKRFVSHGTLNLMIENESLYFIPIKTNTENEGILLDYIQIRDYTSRFYYKFCPSSSKLYISLVFNVSFLIFKQKSDVSNT